MGLGIAYGIAVGGGSRIKQVFMLIHSKLIDLLTAAVGLVELGFLSTIIFLLSLFSFFSLVLELLCFLKRIMF